MSKVINSVRRHSRSVTFSSCGAPLFHVQVRPTYYGEIESVLYGELRALDAIEPIDDPPRWDTVYAVAGTTSYPGDAYAVETYLGVHGYWQSDHWRRWTEEHPERAAPVWKGVATAARKGRYYLIPELFDAGCSHAEGDDVAAAVEAILKRPQPGEPPAPLGASRRREPADGIAARHIHVEP
jgi:hypothetical protein